MDREYRAIVVATKGKNGVLFAKRSDSEEETKAILGDELLRLLSISPADVSFSARKDDCGNYVIEALYDWYVHSIEYTICIERKNLCGDTPDDAEEAQPE